MGGVAGVVVVKGVEVGYGCGETVCVWTSWYGLPVVE